MTVASWRIAADTPDYESDDMTGKGAELSGGRWNRAGTPMIYSASTVSLACLETLVHLDTGGLPLNRFLVRLDVPDALIAGARVETGTTLPVGWTARPPGRVSIDEGQRWLTGLTSAVLIVPSAIVPEERNILVNPRHPHARRIEAVKMRPWLYDARLG